jgi:hypothetical protein
MTESSASRHPAASGNLKDLTDVGHDRRRGWLSQAARKRGGHSTCLRINPVRDRTELAEGPIHPRNHVLLAAVGMGVGDNDHTLGSFQNVVANDNAVDGVFRNRGAGYLDARLGTRNPDGIRYWVACFECIRRYIAP